MSAVLLTAAAVEARRGRRPDPRSARIVHLGVGAFHRAHQAWYTFVVDDEREWGISAFTGRSAGVADALSAQDGLYTLTVREAERDDIHLVDILTSVLPGTSESERTGALADPATAIVTLTVTEAGYRLDLSGLPDADDPVMGADLRLLADAVGTGLIPPMSSVLGWLLEGLDARRRNGGGPLAVIPCDNMPANGRLVRTGLTAMAAAYDDGLAVWIDANVSFVSTSVDRITPRTTAADRLLVERETGWIDEAAVVAEPFTDWVLCGDFPAGRPRWERAGARFVDDIEPWERRKLWLLNGAHTILAALGSILGHSTVSEAIADERCRRIVEGFWDEAVRHLPASELDLPAYRAQLVERFENPRIRHELAQISEGQLIKLRARIVPIARAERAAGRDAAACAGALAAVCAEEHLTATIADVRSRVRDIDPVLAADDGFVGSVHAELARVREAASQREEAPA